MLNWRLTFPDDRASCAVLQYLRKCQDDFDTCRSPCLPELFAQFRLPIVSDVAARDVREYEEGKDSHPNEGQLTNYLKGSGDKIILVHIKAAVEGWSD